MVTGSAELSSLAAQLEEIVRRVSDVADLLVADGRSDVAADLFEVERSLATAARRLDTARRTLGWSGAGPKPAPAAHRDGPLVGRHVGGGSLLCRLLPGGGNLVGPPYPRLADRTTVVAWKLTFADDRDG